MPKDSKTTGQKKTLQKNKLNKKDLRIFFGSTQQSPLVHERGESVK